MNFRDWAAALWVAACFSAPASAHPHVFIDAKAGFQFDDSGQLTSLRITWVYDAFTSLTLISLLDLDKDNDGVLSDADLARVVKAQTIWPDTFEGDTYLESAGQPVPLGRPENGAAGMANDRISVSFDLPLQAPLARGAAAKLRIYDPTYYYAYSTVEVASAENCAVSLETFKPDATTSQLQATLAKLSREETPEQDGVGRLFADVVALDCA